MKRSPFKDTRTTSDIVFMGYVTFNAILFDLVVTMKWARGKIKAAGRAALGY